MGVGGVNFSVEKRYKGVRFNVISVTRGWVGVQIPGKKRYVTLEWPLSSSCMSTNNHALSQHRPNPVNFVSIRRVYFHSNASNHSAKLHV